jgi:hypothetical protein
MESNYDLNVIVNVKGDGEKADVTIGFPRHQPALTVEQTAIILASGIALLIKGCASTDGMTDVELMESVISYLNEQFIDTKSFSDAKVFKDGFKGSGVEK